MATRNSKTKTIATVSLAQSAQCERRFEVYPDKAGKFRWRLVADSSGRIVAGSQQSFAHERSAVKAAVREASFYRPSTIGVVILAETPSDSQH